VRSFSLIFLVCGLWCWSGDKPSHGDSHLYLTPKVLNGLGDTTAGVKGEDAWGAAIDFGYKPSGWRVGFELNAAYVEGDGIPASDHGKKAAAEEALTYRGLGLNLVLLQPLGKVVLAGKLGFKHEREKAAVPGHESVSKGDTGLGYALGVEAPLSERLELVMEVEGTAIDSPLGPAVTLGLKFLF